MANAQESRHGAYADDKTKFQLVEETAVLAELREFADEEGVSVSEIYRRGVRRELARYRKRQG